ncbi:hypothetical protein OIE63_32965 [Streptomyces sp. NBC_01795]|uniref:hypothetical protein n=1 Tax=unclassified Streptomyces TaxID=2593676 RepID=UPI002DD8775A|nr:MULTISPECIES: hypothetical protein [unclassified Streptomyces]WSA95834.1 hypothetical protein OIE63_32965 [Streptomyces sp. NBC_01795]WSS11539.1 hypothetical protein OG533_06125 [Streptomyces sp. NBC_01186]
MPPHLKETLAKIGASSSPSAFEEAVDLLGGTLTQVPEIQRKAGAVADVSRFLSEDLRSWLLAQPVSADAEALCVWLADGLAARASYGAFADVIDDLWYPASDDVAIICRDPGSVAVIVIDHEEKVTFTRIEAPD